jgi:hypothetical protein
VSNLLLAGVDSERQQTQIDGQSHIQRVNAVHGVLEQHGKRIELRAQLSRTHRQLLAHFL